ncbi:hypothetical protein [Pseudomonas schmalbachii]|uniref:DUF1828 domain-containing protein n=1 Tax=Pseudomonas schmalbachii TaxID=2816993 RepID=A0ABS3TKG0_9PSED|nr:hypothetical protein [Pseudomonas schmalbachii]MBO3274151.1 hypothetical protein [Pseudomonas schmalbachii]
MSTSARLYQKLKAKASEPERNPIRGQWFNIRLQPDLLAGEQFNIGVGFVDPNGTVHSRFTDDLVRLTCFYDERIDLEEMSFLVDLAAAHYDRASFHDVMLKVISPQIVLGDLAYASGQSVTSILDDFFHETISLVSFADESKAPKPRFQGSSNELLREEVFAWMRQHHHMVAKHIIPADPRFRVRSADQSDLQEHQVELPLRRPGKAAGTIISANCKTLQTAELRILQGAINLATAMRHLENERFGMFILRPDENSGLPEQSLTKFDDLIDESVWKLRDAGVHVGVESSVPELGQEIVSWAA